MPSASKPLPPRCCSNCWRMGTRPDSGGGLVYACLDDPEDRESAIGELDAGMILEAMRCPDWHQPDGNLRDGVEQINRPLRAARYAEQIVLMEEWNRGH